MEEDLAQLLAAAHRAGRHDVDPAPFAALSRDGAFRVQARVMELLGATAGAIKVGIAADGGALVAPIYASMIGDSGALKLPTTNLVGLEVEVAAVLGRDIDAALAAEGEDAMMAAIDHYVMGIEIVGSRFPDRKAASVEVGLADGISALGYAIGTSAWARGTDIDGLSVRLEVDGATIYDAPARHAFGTVLKSFFTYARAQQPHLPLRAGLLVTTGSLCGLVPTTATGHVVATLGEQTVEMDIVPA